MHAPLLDLLVFDINFCQVPGETDYFKIKPDQCCYRNHVGFNTTDDGMTEQYQKCGWNDKFWEIPLHEWSEVDPKTSETVHHQTNACSAKINREALVTWMKFEKVAQTKDNTSDEDGDYGGDNGVKFQTEWLPV